MFKGLQGGDTNITVKIYLIVSFYHKIKNSVKTPNFKHNTMKYILLALLFPFSLAAQSNDLPKIIKDTVFTTSGYNIYEGQEIKVGIGSMPDGDFKYIRTNSASIFNYTSSTGYNGLANQANSFARRNSGLKFKIKSVDQRGNKKHGYVYYAKIGSGPVNYEIDIENAIASGEIATPAEFKKSTGQIVITQQFSLADELTKLKKLYTDSVLTKEEYEVQKKKLLEKQ